MRNVYTVKKRKSPLPELLGEVFDPEDEPFCAENAAADIDCYMWDINHYTPEAHAYAAWDAEGLHVLLCAKEKEICVEAEAFNGEVYRDSCLEFFLQPFEDDARYINIEVNAHGVALIGFGEGRAERLRLESEPEGMHIRASRHRGAWWAVAYTIPGALIRTLYGRVPQPGGKMRGNFYKCDESIHPHFGSWCPVIHYCPDFHRPEHFGTLVLSEE